MKHLVLLCTFFVSCSSYSMQKQEIIAYFPEKDQRSFALMCENKSLPFEGTFANAQVLAYALLGLQRVRIFVADKAVSSSKLDEVLQEAYIISKTPITNEQLQAGLNCIKKTIKDEKLEQSLYILERREKSNGGKNWKTS